MVYCWPCMSMSLCLTKRCPLKAHVTLWTPCLTSWSPADTTAPHSCTFTMSTGTLKCILSPFASIGINSF